MPSYLSFRLIAAAFVCISAPSATLYNEAVSGDLSGDGLAPTALAFTPGANQIFGTTGRATTSVDRDYFTITVPAGYQIGRILELPGTQAGGVSFFGIESGPQLTLPVTAVTANGLLGWTHYAAAAAETDLLPEMAISNNGSSGFSTLAAGQYTFWVQDFTAGTYSYGFNIEVTAAPEPATVVPTVAALSLLAFFGIRSKRKSSLL